MKYPVNLNWHHSWTSESQKAVPWNILCSRVIERFGMPGDKYTTEMTGSAMVLYFKDAEDAFAAKLMLGE